MCNLYSITTNQEAIRGLFRKINRYIGNLAPMPGVSPDYPVISNTERGDEAELVMGWGMPPPPRMGGPRPRSCSLRVARESGLLRVFSLRDDCFQPRDVFQ